MSRYDLCMCAAEILDNFSIYMLTFLVNLIAFIRMNHTFKKKTVKMR